jgi:hypothetical protein
MDPGNTSYLSGNGGIAHVRTGSNPEPTLATRSFMRRVEDRAVPAIARRATAGGMTVTLR